MQAYVEGLLAINTVKEHWRPFSKIALGRPLMGTWSAATPYREDLLKLAEALADDIRLAEQQQAALIYVGHGNEHLSTGLYYELELLLKQRYPQVDVFVGLVEGHPQFSELLAKLSESGRQKVLLKPLMVVAGDHASNDMAGATPTSWKSQLTAAGYQVLPLMQGLGDNSAVRRLFIDHLREAATGAGIELR
jgi:sirohydrochlorin cobaltochelatase